MASPIQQKSQTKQGSSSSSPGGPGEPPSSLLLSQPTSPGIRSSPSYIGTSVQTTVRTVVRTPGKDVVFSHDNRAPPERSWVPSSPRFELVAPGPPGSALPNNFVYYDNLPDGYRPRATPCIAENAAYRTTPELRSMTSKPWPTLPYLPPSSYSVANARMGRDTALPTFSGQPIQATKTYSSSESRKSYFDCSGIASSPCRGLFGVCCRQETAESPSSYGAPSADQGQYEALASFATPQQRHVVDRSGFDRAATTTTTRVIRSGTAPSYYFAGPIAPIRAPLSATSRTERPTEFTPLPPSPAFSRAARSDYTPSDPAFTARTPAPSRAPLSPPSPAHAAPDRLREFFWFQFVQLQQQETCLPGADGLPARIATEESGIRPGGVDGGRQEGLESGQKDQGRPDSTPALSRSEKDAAEGQPTPASSPAKTPSPDLLSGGQAQEKQEEPSATGGGQDRKCLAESNTHVAPPEGAARPLEQQETAVAGPLSEKEPTQPEEGAESQAQAEPQKTGTDPHESGTAVAASCPTPKDKTLEEKPEKSQDLISKDDCGEGITSEELKRRGEDVQTAADFLLLLEKHEQDALRKMEVKLRLFAYGSLDDFFYDFLPVLQIHQEVCFLSLSEAVSCRPRAVVHRLTLLTSIHI